MSRERPDPSTLSQLQGVKDSLGLANSRIRPASPDDEPHIIDDEPALPACVNCGYTQQGQSIDRCPECGLGWASRLRDPTPWSMDGPTVATWAATALGVVSWDDRLRIRTSLIPATPASRRFSMRCVIKVADGEITSQKLRRYFFGMSTNESLVIIDSCFGGKFIDQLRGTTNAVVLSTTDDRDVGYGNGLLPFWWALTNPGSDANQDGEVSVKEAFASAYPAMLRAGEKARRMNYVSATNPYVADLMKTAGYATPQLEELGTAKAEAFSVSIKKPASGP